MNNEFFVINLMLFTWVIINPNSYANLQRAEFLSLILDVIPLGC